MNPIKQIIRLPRQNTKTLKVFASVAPDISEAFEYCRSVTWHCAKTFYFASYFLPPVKRYACYAIYAFCRYVDDLVDNAPEGAYASQISALLEEWRRDLGHVFDKSWVAASAADDEKTKVLKAWAYTLERFDIPRHLPEELIEGVLMDTHVSRFETFDELYRYSYLVASVVGLMTSEVFGYSSKLAIPKAIDLGIAMQLTNILRDVGEDADRGRIYLPGAELRAYGVSESDILYKRSSPELIHLLKFQIERAHEYYESADEGIKLLASDSRVTVQLMSTNYRRILGAIVRNNYDVYSKRASLSLTEKALAVPRAYFRHRKF